ncbi:MAG: hypothetical protein ACU0B1_10450 [Thermohalobaculum sp.]
MHPYHHKTILLLGLLGMARPSTAATISPIDANGHPYLSFQGDITAGDSAKFEAALDATPQAQSVFLNSNGGAIIESLAIGELVRRRAINTVILDEATCTSACGLIWLAGAKRYIFGSGKVGFHAAYIESGGQAKETGIGNALIGAYLARLNLSYKAIAYFTAASPTEMTWLHADEARELGIEVVSIPQSSTVTSKNIGSQSDFMPAGLPSQSKSAEDFINKYFSTWSGQNENVDDIEIFYQDAVEFYGPLTGRKKIMQEKRKFSLRWPVRQYKIEHEKTRVSCSSRCAVSGVVDWDTFSEARHVRSLGRADFRFEIIAVNSALGWVIVHESGSVISSQKIGIQSGNKAHSGIDLTAKFTDVQRKAIGEAMRKCYAQDTTATSYQSYVAIITIDIDAAGRVRNAWVSGADERRAQSDQAFRDFVNRSLRTVLDPRCTRLPIPSEVLEHEPQFITLRFRP